jgi:hypothetical protein
MEEGGGRVNLQGEAGSYKPGISKGENCGGKLRVKK